MVLSPTITVFVSASGSITSTVTADVHGSLSATGGLEYDNGDFRYVASV